MLEDGDVSLEDQPEFLNVLGKMCSQLKTIPDSLRIESHLNGSINEGYKGGRGTVSRGEYGGRPVAVKTLHLHLTGNSEGRLDVSVKLSRGQSGIHSHSQ